MWTVLEYAAWAISAGLLLWMLIDAIGVSREYGEDALLSSREGVDELIEHGDVPEAKGAQS